MQYSISSTKSSRPALATAAFLLFAVLGASLFFALAPVVARGEEKIEVPPSKVETPPPSNEQIIRIQAGRFGLNEVAKLLGLIDKNNCTSGGVDKQTGVANLERCTATDLHQVVLKLIQVALGFTSLIALIFVLYGGLTWITAMGNQEKVTKGRDILIWAAIGLFVVMFAWGIITYIIYTSSRVIA